MAFETSQVSAIASLAPRDDLMRANGRLQASYSAMGVLGSLLAGLAVAVLPVPLLLLGDALSFLVSAGALALIGRRFNDLKEAAGNEEEAPPLSADLLAGVRYVVGQPVLLCLAVMLALTNLVGSTPNAQLVVFAKRHLQASDQQVGLLYAAGGVGVIILSLLADRLQRRFAHGQVAVGALMLHGLFIAVFAATPWYWAAVAPWALSAGTEALFNVATASLVQTVIPDRLMGRVISVLRVLAWSAIPLGTILGGLIIERTGQVAVVYAAVGGLILAVAFAFTFTPLRRRGARAAAAGHSARGANAFSSRGAGGHGHPTTLSGGARFIAPGPPPPSSGWCDRATGRDESRPYKSSRGAHSPAYRTLDGLRFDGLACTIDASRG